MIKLKMTLFEDVNDEINDEVNFRNLVTSVLETGDGTFEDLYDTLGNEIFWDGNIDTLLDNDNYFEDGLPIGINNVDELIEEFHFTDDDIVNSAYIRKIILDSIGPVYEWDVWWTDIQNVDSSVSREMSEDMLDALWTDGDVWEYFEYYDADLNDSDVEDKLSNCCDDRNKKAIKRLPIWNDPNLPFDDLIKEENVSEENKDSYYEFLQCCRLAINDAYASGSANEAINDFEKCVASACPTGVTISERNGHSYRRFTVNLEEFAPTLNAKASLISDIIYESPSYYITDAFERVVLQKFIDEFYFREPRYGWWDFDEGTFNECLNDRIYEEFDV